MANITNTLDLGTLVSGTTYDIPANTSVTAVYSGSLDGTITLTSSVDANTNLVPYTDDTYTTIINTERDEEARTKTFAFTHNQPVYFKNAISTTPYQVTFDFVRPSNQEDLVESILPEEGEVESLKEFTLTVTGSMTMPAQETMMAYLYKGDEKVAETTLPQNYQKSLTFTFENEVTEPGDYTLVIPEGMFQVGSSAANINSEWRFEYTVVAPQPKMNVSIVGGATEAEAVTFNNLNGSVTFENTTATIANQWTQVGLFSIPAGASAGFAGSCYVEFTVTQVSDTEYTLTPNAYQLATLDPNTAYQFKIPAGYFTYADGSSSPAYETWVKYEAPQVSDVTIAFSPAGGSEDAPVQVALEDFSNITLTLTGAESIALSTAALTEDSAIRLRAWSDYWADYSDAMVFKPELVEGTTYKLVAFDENWATNLPLLTSGKYELNVPAGTFVYNGEETNVNLTTTTYYNLVLPTYTIVPEPDSTIEATETTGLTQVQIRFNNEASVTPSQTVTVSLKKDGEVVEEGIFAQINWAQRNTAAIWFSKTYTESGEYEVVLPEGYVTLGSGSNAEAMTIKYTVVGPTVAEPTVTFDPAGGATEAEATQITSFEIKVIPQNAEKMTWFNNGWNTCFQVYNEAEQSWFTESVWVVTEDNGDGTTTIKPDPSMGFTPVVGETYRLYIPNSEFYYNDDQTLKNKETIVYYQYVESISTEPEMIIYPAKGDVVSEITDGTFIIEFKNVENVEVSYDGTSDNSTNGIQLMGTGTDKGWNINYLKVEAIEGETNKFKLVSRPYQSVDNNARYKEFPITAEGTYGLYMPYGIFTYDGQSSAYIYDEEYFTVGTVAEPAMVVTPENGATIASYEDIQISFENVTTVEINPNALDADMGLMLLIPDEDWGYLTVVKPVAIEGETNKFGLEILDGSLPESYSTLQFVAEAGAFTMDGEDSPAIDYTYTVAAVGEPTMVVTPEEGTAFKQIDGDTFLVEFQNVSEVTVNESFTDWNSETLIMLYSVDEGGYAKTITNLKPVAVEGSANQFKFEVFSQAATQFPITEEGTWCLWIPEGTFSMNGVSSPEFGATYTVSSNLEPEMVVTPEAGTTVKALTSDVVTISFKNATEVTINSGALNESNAKIMFMTPSGGYHHVMPVAIEGETNKFRLVNFDGTDFNLTTEGTYGIWIVGGFPQPAFYMDGTPSPDFYEAEYITVAPYTYTAEPAEGFVPSIKDIALTFDPGVQGMNKDASGSVVLYKDDTEVEKVSVEDLMLAGWDAALGSSLVVSFSKEYTESGEYKVVIPANVVELTGGITNKEITLNYTVGGEVSEWTAVADPTPGVVDSILSILVTFEGAEQLSVSSEAGPNDFPYFGTVAEDGTVTKLQSGVFPFVMGNTVELSINSDDPITDPGKYAFVIPATYCLVDGVAMTEDLRFEYTIEGAQPEYTVVINPADGTTVSGEELYVITVTFEGAKSIELDGNMSTTFNQIDDNGDALTSIYQTPSVEGNVATFTVMELHKPYLDPKGKFRFTIPANMVTITDANDVVGKNKENIVATYDSTGTGVDTIGLDAKDLNIYSVNGMLIKRNATGADVKALEPGVYIINGKKVFKK